MTTSTMSLLQRIGTISFYFCGQQGTKKVDLYIENTEVHLFLVSLSRLIAFTEV